MNRFVNDMEASTRIDIPSWMLSKNKIEDIEGINQKYKFFGKRASSSGFLRSTLSNISKVFQNELYNERFAESGKFLQSIDPRVKLLTFLFYMVLCGLTRSIFILTLLSFVALMYAKLSGLEVKSFIKRVWLILPPIVFILSLPASTSLFIKGTPLFYLFGDIYISESGIIAIARMALRIGTSFSFGYLLVMTSRWNHLTKSLTVLHVPTLVISILNMTYRYIFILSKIAFDSMEARFLRTIGQLKNKQNREFIANRISFIFVKSSFLSDDIYHSMRCRCYTGEPVALKSFKIRSLDYLWIINNIIVIFILVIGEVLL